MVQGGNNGNVINSTEILTSTYNQLELEISSMQKELNNNISNMMSSTGGDIQKINSALSTTNSNVSALSTRVGTAETNINNLVTKTNTTNTNLNTTNSNVTALTTRVSTAETNINNLGTRITNITPIAVNSVSLPIASWKEDTAAGDFYFDITNSNITATTVVDVNFPKQYQDYASFFGIASVCESSAGKVRIWADIKPTIAMTCSLFIQPSR